MIEEAAKQWLIEHGAGIEIEQVHGLLLVFLPLSAFRMWYSEGSRGPHRICLLHDVREYVHFDDRADTFESGILFPEEQGLC